MLFPLFHTISTPHEYRQDFRKYIPTVLPEKQGAQVSVLALRYKGSSHCTITLMQKHVHGEKYAIKPNLHNLVCFKYYF